VASIRVADAGGFDLDDLRAEIGSDRRRPGPAIKLAQPITFYTGVKILVILVTYKFFILV